MRRRCTDSYNTNMSGNVARHADRQRPGPAVLRFFIKYRCFVIPIALFMLVQIVLALRLAFLHCSEDSDAPGVRLKWTGNSKSPVDLTGHSDERTQSFLESRQTSTSRTQLDLDTLTFTPDCNITTKEAVSAIQRAKTQSCKEQLAKTACKIADNSLYVNRLPRKCMNDVKTYGKHIGCFKDDKQQRILPDHFTNLKETNSRQNCIDLCLQSGFQYAGVQYSVECFCGNLEPSGSLDLPLSECNMKCPDASLPSQEMSWVDQFCGGYFAMNVFETGVSIGHDGKSQVVGLEDFTVSDNEVSGNSTRIVFFLTLNGRALRQVVRLVKALFHERHYFYIHVDSRQDYLYRELLVLSHKLPNNVRFMANRRATIWGGASLLTVLLQGMRDLTFHAHEWNWDWDYIINLSESDFPLKSTKQLQYFLSQNNGKNFLKSHGRDVQKFIQKQGLDKTFDECEYRMWRVGDRKLPSGILMDGGSDWIALHRDFVEYAVKSDDELVMGLRTVFKYTLLPAESFFHTLLRNSEMCDTFIDNNLHVTNWRRKLGCKCQYKNIVDWCGCSPNDFRLTDWNRLQLTESRLLFFGRKFESVVNQGIVNQLESWLYPERFENNFPTLDRFWMSLYHHHDLSPKPDDALVTLGRSLSRIASKVFLSKCMPTFSTEIEHNQVYGSNISSYKVDLIELTAHNHDDQFEGVLVKFHTSLIDTTGEELTLNMETWLKSDTVVEMAAENQRTSKFQGRLKDLKVGGDYDQKEQIFRNFAGALGPFSEPTLTYSVFTSDSFNVSVAWLDPMYTIQSTSNVTISDGSTANFVKPTLKSPLLPGNWTIKIYTMQHDLLYRVKFGVLPLEIYQGKILSPSEERLINSNDGTLNVSTSSQTLRQIDDLVSSYFTIQDFCLEKHVNHLTLSRWKTKNDIHDNNGYPDDPSNSQYQNQIHNSVETLETSLCSHTQWSSFYPDPKSTILGIDPRTGLLMP